MGLEYPAAAGLTARLRAAGCVFAEEEAALLLAEPGDAAALEARVAARERGEPLEYVLGWAAFAELRLVVEPGVFVPRRRTELLAAQAVVLARPGTVLVDVCCGAGAVGALVLARCPGVEVHSCDVEPVAVRCARRNTEPAGGRVHEGDLFEALPTGLRGRVDVVTANAPYVPTAEIAAMPAEARDHEPWVTLDGGTDGLGVQRQVIEGAVAWLRPGGHLLVETSRRQRPATDALMRAAGLGTRVIEDGDLGATVVVGVQPGG